MRNAIFQQENLKGRDHLGELDVDGKLKKCGVNRVQLAEYRVQMSVLFRRIMKGKSLRCSLIWRQTLFSK
jgi:hypothetical protein